VLLMFIFIVNSESFFFFLVIPEYALEIKGNFKILYSDIQLMRLWAKIYRF
jgi:hypothetical protein